MHMTCNILSLPLKDNFKILLTLLVLLAGFSSPLRAQSEQLPMQKLQLDNLESFESAPANWQVAGGAFMDTYQYRHVEPSKGTGVLVNTASGDNPGDIFSRWNHGDIDLEMDIMMARGSNSGIYLQGRYEIQLLDSWGVDTPKFSDMGGVYQWWEDDRGVGGTAPLVNAALAPGVWQHIEIKFRAPEFNEQGKKIEDARLEEVILNGKVIHTDLELVHPTGGAISNKEVARGPLRIQGDHGPVAIRNIKYKRYDNAPLELSNLSYRYYQKSLKKGARPVSIISPSNLQNEGTAEKVNLDEVKSTGEFAIVYEGTIRIDEPGSYLFELRTAGGGRLAIDGTPLIESKAANRWWNVHTAKTELSKGAHKVTLTYFRGERGSAPALSLTAEGPGIEKHNLHAPSAVPAEREDVDMPKILDPEDKPVLMHGFMDMPDRVHPHSAAVGYPADIHFGIDLNNGSVMKLWKGEFLDISTMWVGRGGGKLALNEAAALTFSGAPSLAFLSNRNAAWPNALQEGTDYEFNSYRFGKGNQLIMNYRMNKVAVEDRLSPHNGGRELKRTLRFTSESLSGNLYFRIAAGENISRLPNGLYQVNGKSYLLNLGEDTARRARIRQSEGQAELIVPVADTRNSSISYRYVW